MSTDSSSLREAIEINAILDRVARLTGAKSDAALAEALNTSRQVISGWRKRGTIPYDKLVEFAQEFEVVSLNYLLWGEEADLLEVPLDEGQISPKMLEIVGDVLLDAADKVRKEKGAGYERFMQGPQIFAYAAMVYNRIIGRLPKGQVWTPEIDEEIEHLVQIALVDFERYKDFLPAQDPSSGRSGQKSGQPDAGDEQDSSSNDRHNPRPSSSNVHQNIEGEGHQVAGGNIENSGGVSIGGRHKK